MLKGKAWYNTWLAVVLLLADFVQSDEIYRRRMRFSSSLGSPMRKWHPQHSPYLKHQKRNTIWLDIQWYVHRMVDSFSAAQIEVTKYQKTNYKGLSIPHDKIVMTPFRPWAVTLINYIPQVFTNNWKHNSSNISIRRIYPIVVPKCDKSFGWQKWNIYPLFYCNILCLFKTD